MRLPAPADSRLSELRHFSVIVSGLSVLHD